MKSIGALLLTAGCSSRFGPENKLLAEVDGKPMVRTVADTLTRSAGFDEIIAITGHDAPAVELALKRLPVRIAFNVGWRHGLGSSIAFGLSQLSPSVDGAAIVLGDMPFVTTALLDRLVSEFNESDGEAIVFPVTRSGEQRNPVIWPRRFFGRLMRLSGHGGGKALLTEARDSCIAVRWTDERCLLDIDDPDALRGARQAASAQTPATTATSCLRSMAAEPVSQMSRHRRTGSPLS